MRGVGAPEVLGGDPPPEMLDRQADLGGTRRRNFGFRVVPAGATFQRFFPDRPGMPSSTKNLASFLARAAMSRCLATASAGSPPYGGDAGWPHREPAGNGIPNHFPVVLVNVMVAIPAGEAQIVFVRGSVIADPLRRVGGGGWRGRCIWQRAAGAPQPTQRRSMETLHRASQRVVIDDLVQPLSPDSGQDLFSQAH